MHLIHTIDCNFLTPLQIYIAILKFDFFLFLGFEVQFLVIVTQTSDVEFALTIASLPVTVILLLLAAYCTRKEIVAGMIATIVCSHLLGTDEYLSNLPPLDCLLWSTRLLPFQASQDVCRQ
jgi:hypothetical protein